MTFSTLYHDWQRDDPTHSPFDRCAPNLRALAAELDRRWPWLTDLGCFVRRPVRGSSSTPSSHAFGAAIDLGFPREMNSTVGSHVCGFLVGWSNELGVQAIHDYRRSRIWRAGRTSSLDEACTKWWRAQRRSSVTQMGQTWANHLHIETHPGSWDDDRAAATRGVA